MILNSTEINTIMDALAIMSRATVTDKQKEWAGELRIKMRDHWDEGFSFVSRKVDGNLHPTEQNYPEMTTRFREIQEEMYQVFLEKK